MRVTYAHPSFSLKMLLSPGWWGEFGCRTGSGAAEWPLVENSASRVGGRNTVGPDVRIGRWPGPLMARGSTIVTKVGRRFVVNVCERVAPTMVAQSLWRKRRAGDPFRRCCAQRESLAARRTSEVSDCMARQSLGEATRAPILGRHDSDGAESEEEAEEGPRVVVGHRGTPRHLSHWVFVHKNLDRAFGGAHGDKWHDFGHALSANRHVEIVGLNEVCLEDGVPPPGLPRGWAAFTVSRSSTKAGVCLLSRVERRPVLLETVVNEFVELVAIVVYEGKWPMIVMEAYVHPDLAVGQLIRSLCSRWMI